jgi:hypothetical protein
MCLTTRCVYFLLGLLLVLLITTLTSLLVRSKRSTNALPISRGNDNTGDENDDEAHNVEEGPDSPNGSPSPLFKPESRGGHSFW